MHIPQTKLKEIIIKAGLVNEALYQKALEESSRMGTSIENVLIGEGHMDERYFYEAVSDYLGVQVYHPNLEELGKTDFTLIPESVAKTYTVFLLGRDHQTLKVAMTDPNNLAVIHYLESRFKSHIEPFLITSSDFSELLNLYKRNIGKEFTRIIEENTKKIVMSSQEKNLATELPVITILDTILEHAANNRSSDIHLEGTSKNVIVRYRIDGILHDIVELPASIQPALIARIKIMSNLQIDEHRIPQDGRFKFNFEKEEIAVRVSIMPTLRGEKVVLRLLAGSHRLLNLQDLGATQKNLELLQNCIKRTNGLILVTGPTGSGKTTTLYTLISILNKPEVSISTIEDPIEYDITRVNQTQVNTKTGLTFAEGLRAFLRQNPDIMMVGEIRDPETAELAIQASLTGHLVLSTLHTDDAASALPRFIDLKAEPFLVASTFRTVIAQRLVRRVCNACTESRPITDDIKKIIIEQMLKSNKYRTVDMPTQFYSGQGCSKCGHSGYRGQIGIFEVLEVTSSIADLILKRASADIIKDTALQQGMITMFEDGLEKAESGITTIDEVLRVIRM